MVLGNTSIAADSYISFIGAGSDRNAGIRWGADATGSDQFNLTSNTTNGDLNLNILGATRTFNIRAAASQSANILELQNSAASVLGRFEATGDLWVTGAVRSLFYTNRNNTGGYLNYSSDSPMFEQRIATEVGLRVRGAASQTADVFQVQNSSGGNLFRVTPDDARFAGAVMAGNSGSGVLGTLTSYATTAATIGAVVRGAASQSANLQQWQNSAGGVLAFVRNDGVFRASFVATLGNFTILGDSNSGGFLRMTKQTAALANQGADIGGIYFRDGTNAGTLKLVVRAGAAGAETTILDNIPT
jgi:hypothetical protein